MNCPPDRRRTLTVVLCALLSLVIAAPGVVSAQSSGQASTDEPIVAPNLFGTTGGFNLNSAETPDKGTWTFGLYFNNSDRLVQVVSCLMPPLTSDWAYDENRISASIGYSVVDNVELSLMLPYEEYDGARENRIGTINAREYIETIDADGLGNIRLGLKWRLFERDRSAFALNAFIEPATGDDDEGVAADDTGWGLGLNYNVGNLLLNLGYRDRGDGATGGGVAPAMEGPELAEEITGGIGYILPASDRLDWITELSGVAFQGDFPRPPDYLDLTSGVRVSLGAQSNWALNAAARFNVSDYGDTDGIGGLVGLTYTPSETRRARRERLEREETERQAEIDRQRREQEEAERLREEERRREEERLRQEEERREREEAERRQREDEERRRQLEAPKAPEVIESVCLFASGSTRVDNRCQKILDRDVALRMRNAPESTALIIGYTDSTGSNSTNETISRRRAEAVKQILVNRHGIDADRITVEGHGANEPAADNTTAAGREKNRRAVIRLTLHGE